MAEESIIDYKALFEQERLRREDADRKAEQERLGREQERLGREEADRKAELERLGREEADRKAELERLGRVEADRKAEQERLGRVEADRKAEQERLGRVEADRRAEGAEKKVEEQTVRYQVSPVDALRSPLPELVFDTHSKSSTSQKVGCKLPVRVEKWDSFAQDKQSLLEKCTHPIIDRVRDIQVDEAGAPKETGVHGVVHPILFNTIRMLREAGLEYDRTRLLGVETGRVVSAGGITDVNIFLNTNTLCLIGELKRPSVAFSDAHPVDAYNDPVNTVHGPNVRYTILQTYHYMVMKGGGDERLKYGFFTNYDLWCFMYRDVVDENEVLYVSPFFKRQDDARLAIAYILFVVATSDAISLKVGKFGGEEGLRLDDNERGDDGDEEEDRRPVNPPPTQAPVTNASTGSGVWARAMGRLGRRNNGFFSVGNVVAGVEFTTTKAVLGLDNLVLNAARQSEIISSSVKSTAYRGQINGLDLVWRQTDTYKLPRVDSDFSLPVLEEMVTTELTVYQHLRAVWNVLVPEFVYFGQDCAMLWVFVTKYGGESLSSIAKRSGGLTGEIKTRAREALQELHRHEVIHGDAVPRNAIYRAEDGRVLWIDFEFASLLVPNATEEQRVRFDEEARMELETFNKELALIPEPMDARIPSCAAAATEVVDASPKAKRSSPSKVKRSKVFATCCCQHPQ